MALAESQLYCNYAYYVLEFCLYVHNTPILDVSQNISVSRFPVQWISLPADFCVFSENTNILAISEFI